MIRGARASDREQTTAQSVSASYAEPTTTQGAGALGPFVAVFGGILAIGVVVTILIIRQTPAPPSVAAGAPPPAQSANDDDSRGLPLLLVEIGKNVGAQ